MMKKCVKILTGVTVAGLLLTGCAASNSKEKPLDQGSAKTVEQQSEIITEEEAKQIALSQVPGAEESHIYKFGTDYDRGQLEYEGTIIFEEMEYEFEIDGYSGTIREWDKESVYD